MPTFNSNDIILGGTGTAGGIGNVNLNGAVRLAGANRDSTAQAIRNYAVSKNVYGTGADLANAKNILGNVGYNFIDTGASGFIMPSFTSNDIILGGTGTAGGIGNVNLNGAVRLAGADRDATAQAIRDYAGIKTPSSSTPTGSSTTVLQQGSQGEAVKELQSNLTYLGYDTKGIDGDFGPNTYNAVIAFQKDYGLTQDGVVGSQTENAIELALSRKAPVQTDTDYLQMGSTGAAVSRLQSKLSALGYYKDSIDGIFGQNTYNAVKELQSDFGLTVDGIAGPRTMRALNTALQEAGITEDPAGTVSPATLKMGDSGDSVRKLQSELNYLGYDTNGVDGIFGQKTYNAVITFQNNNGLIQDGIVGPKTWDAINKAVIAKMPNVPPPYNKGDGNWLYDLAMDFNINITKSQAPMTVYEVDDGLVACKMEFHVIANVNSSAATSIGDGSIQSTLPNGSRVELSKEGATLSATISKNGYESSISCKYSWPNSTIDIITSYTPFEGAGPTIELKTSFTIREARILAVGAADALAGIGLAVTISTGGADIPLITALGPKLADILHKLFYLSPAGA